MAKPRASDAPVDERTRLLVDSDSNLVSYIQAASHDNITKNDTEEDIDASGFGNVLCRSRSITTGLGMEPESQETAMLQGHRMYNNRQGRLEETKWSSIHCRGLPEGAVRSTVSEVGEAKAKSPFLAGVSIGRFWLIFSVVLVSYFISCFDGTIMVSSHPVITSYFHSSNSASWLSTAFLLTSTAFQPLFGRLSDTIGRKKPYIFSLFLFLVATIWCALAQSMTSFILARAVCGLGAGGMITMGSIITSDLVPIEIRGVYQSYINLNYGVGAAAGAALGGWVADSLGWRWEFGMQVPFLVICLCIACITLPKDLGMAEGIKTKSLWEAIQIFDYQGSLLLTTSITFLILGLNLGGNIFSWAHPLILASFAVFSICFPLFIYVESRVALPIVPLEMINQNPRAGLILANALGSVVTNSVTFNIPLFFQAVLLESATNSGLRLLIPSIGASIAGTAAGFLITWTKNLKWVLVLGVGFMLAGSIGLSTMKIGLPNWVYFVLLVPCSVGQGFMFPGTFMAVLAVSPQSEQAVVTSTLILWRSLGMVLGVAMSSLVLQNALVLYLQRNVMGPEKDQVIEAVRKSVTSIKDLAPTYREQVRDSYSLSLRATFILAALVSVVCVGITLPLRLPRLGNRK